MYFYDLPPESREYKIVLIKIVNECLKVEIGINYIVKVNTKLTVEELLRLLYEECKRDGKLEKQKNKNLEINYQFKVNICEILHVYFSKLDQAIIQFKKGSKEFTQMLDLYMEKLKQNKKFLSIQEQYFIGQYLTGLINIYFEHFLKDIGMIAIKMLSDSNQVKEEQKVFEFTSILIENIEAIHIAIDGKESFSFTQGKLLSNLAQLAKNFGFQIPPQFKALQDTFEQEQILNTIHTTDEGYQMYDVFERPVLKQAKVLQAKSLTFLKNQKKMKSLVDVISFTKKTSKKSKQNDQEQSAFLTCWISFLDMLNKSVFIKQSLKEEQMKFPNVIMNVTEMFEGQKEDVRLREMLVSKDDIIVKFLQYIQYWKAKKANRNTIIFILKSIRSLVSIGKKIEGEDEKEKIKRQNHLDSLNTTAIALKLYWKDKQTEDNYIYQLIKLIISLLDGGNKNIQMSILQLFKNNPDSEAFFRKIYNVLSEEISSIKKSQKNVITISDESQSKLKRKFIEKTLRVIQLLCEGHNTYLQDYLRQQTNSKISYDLVNLMVKLVITHRISNASYESVLQCLETLTEVVQGPCKENQMVIVTSKFLEWTIDLLREEEKLFEIKATLKQPKKEPQSEDLKEKEEESKLDTVQNEPEKPSFGKKLLAIHRGYLMRLKYKATVTLLSLLEMQENNEEIVNRMIRSIPCSVLASELSKLYETYKLIYKEDYIQEAFKNYESEIDLEQEETDSQQLVIEYGFNLFILTNILMIKNKKSQETELEEIQQLIQDYQYIKETKDDSNHFQLIYSLIGLLGGLSILGDLSKLGTSMLATGLGALKNMAGGADQAALSELQKEKERKRKQKEAFSFFSQNTAFIEVVREGQLQRMYFPILPQCKTLPKESKMQFHENVDHSSTRDKLGSLMEEANIMIKVMNHEEKLRKLFKTSKIIELIATHKSLWENLAFVANIIVNLTIIASYSEKVYTSSLPQYNTPNINVFNSGSYSDQQYIDWTESNLISYQNSQIDDSKLFNARLYEPRLFFNNQYTFTKNLITILGIITLCFSSLVVLFFFLKKAPLLLQDKWHHFFNTKAKFMKKTILFFKTVISSFIACCTDFDFVYYSCYMACLILGLTIHPFIFVFLLADFLRIATLKIVVKAIWISKGQMGLTFLVFILVEYYFAVIGYMYFFNQYTGNRCDVMWQCFLETFDQTFKNGGAIGDYLLDPKLKEDPNCEDECAYLPVNYGLSAYQQDRYIYRFMFSMLFKFLLVILIINMVSGIIIDTFGALKDQMLEKERNLTEFCFICGFEREKLDKSTEHGYYSHIKKDHYMWNYVYYKAYLTFKSKMEFSGNETYIKRQIHSHDIDWFPVKMQDCTQRQLTLGQWGSRMMKMKRMTQQNLQQQMK